ncbi:MAG: BMP family lipoprotein [Anaerovoracaceae bacterium]|jgi:basic membrane protein A
MKKILALCLILMLLVSLASCDTTNAQPINPLPKVVMVASEGGLGDKSFNDMAYEGILRAAEDYKIEVQIEEPENRNAYIETVSAAAAEADLVIAVGYIEADALLEIAENSPDTFFAVVDSDVEAPDNVMSLSFKEEEGSFLVGVIAALTSETQIVGFVGGAEDETIESFEFGYRAGVKAVNPEARVLVEYTGCFDDAEHGKTAALSLIEEGADVVFHAAGECGIGVIEAAGEKGVWAIGVDKDQSELNPDAVLCSMFKRVDNGVYLSIQSFMDGKFEGGVYEFGLDFEAVGYSDQADNLPEEIKSQADLYAKAIIAGDIYVPKNREQFEEFEVPEDGLL